MPRGSCVCATSRVALLELDGGWLGINWDSRDEMPDDRADDDECEDDADGYQAGFEPTGHYRITIQTAIVTAMRAPAPIQPQGIPLRTCVLN